MEIEDTFECMPIGGYWRKIYDGYPWTIQTFSVTYELDNTGVDGAKVLRDWVRDNLGYTPRSTYAQLYFKTKEDAIAFKLRWA